MPSREMTLEEWVTRLPWSHRARQEFEALRAAHQERDADARRLDTLTTRGWALLPPDRNNATWAVQDGEMNTLGTGESARAAIDAAMAPDTQTEG